jgi:hypothetical protein
VVGHVICYFRRIFGVDRIELREHNEGSRRASGRTVRDIEAMMTDI